MTEIADRVAAVRNFLDASGGYVPEPLLVNARTAVDRTGERLERSAEHTVIALAGSTGSGKSSIFNAIAGMALSPVGFCRPTTTVAHACVWGTDGAEGLLDWLGVPPGQRFARESVLDGEDQAALRGLILMDLPDFDTVVESHRSEADRLLRLVDMVVWVLDPQKYADEIAHAGYLRKFAKYRAVTVVALNRADTLSHADTQRCVDDLRQLLAADGLGEVPVLATSTVGQPGLGGLVPLLEQAVSSHGAAIARLEADLGCAVAELTATTAGTLPAEPDLERAISVTVEALAVCAGVPDLVEQAETEHRQRAALATAWPLLGWVRRILPAAKGGHGQQTHTDGEPEPTVTAATSAATLAARQFADSAAAGLPEPWPTAARSAAREHETQVPGRLREAIAGTDLGLDQRPEWWRAVGIAQLVTTGVVLLGLVLLAVDVAAGVGGVLLPLLLLIGGLLCGTGLTLAVRPLITAAARLARQQAQVRLMRAVSGVADELIVDRVRAVLFAYGAARGALEQASGQAVRQPGS